MRPSTQSNFESSMDKRNKLGSVLLNNAIKIQEMFQFYLLFQTTGMIKKKALQEGIQNWMAVLSVDFKKSSETFTPRFMMD
jgi:hypothetical protein